MTAPDSGPLPAPVEVAGAPVHPVTLQQTLDFIERTVREGGRAAVMNVNAHAVLIAGDDASFAAALRAAPLVFCDGKAVQWAGHLLGTPIPERFTPPDWIDRLADSCAREGWGMYFLGARPGVAADAADRLKVRHPGLRIDTTHGYFDHEGAENDAVIDAINRSGARLLFVGFGMPAQELWIDRNLPRLQVNVALPVGAMFDYVAERVRRAPPWAGRMGLEWLVRLAVEPGRLWRRYLLGNPRFIWRVLRQRLGG